MEKVFKKIAQSRPLLVNFSYFQQQFLLKNQPQRLLVYFSYFQQQFLLKNCKLQRDSNLDRWNEGEHADHLTTTRLITGEPFIIQYPTFK